MQQKIIIYIMDNMNLKNIMVLVFYFYKRKVKLGSLYNFLITY